MSSDQLNISTNIASLFDTVRKQADAYANVFELLTRKSYDLDRQRHTTHLATVAMKEESDYALHEFKTKCLEVISEFKHEISEVHELHNELDSIVKLKTVLESLQTNFNANTIQLDDSIKTIASTIKKETEKEFQAIERKVASKIQLIENHVTTFDSRLYSIQEFQKREVSILGDEVDRFKNKIAETKYIVDETNKIVHNMMEKAELQFNEKLAKFHIELDDKVNSVFNQLSNEKNTPKGTTKNNKLNNDTSFVTNRIKQLESRINRTMVFTVLIAIVSIIVSFMIKR